MKKNNDIRSISHIAMVLTISLFSVILIIFNFIFNWEKWTIPFAVIGMLLSLGMHIFHKLDERVRIYIYSVILYMELFFYSVKIKTLYDATPVIILVLVILAMTQERFLTWIGLGVGYLGMTFHLFMRNADPNPENRFRFTPSHITRTVWHFVIVAIGTFVIIKLLDALRRTEKNYESEIDDLKNENQSASDFLANVSHEIRTPINAVIGLSEVSLEHEQDDRIKSNLLSVKEAGKRIADQISDILDYSEIDRKTVAVSQENYMISSMINDIINEIKMYKKPDTELLIDIDSDIPAVMNSDVFKLKKIIKHLLVNGLRYTKEGVVYIHFSAVPEDYGVNLCVEISDTGIGMNPEEVERFAGKFYQSDSGRSRAIGGLGLGMSIVAGFVAALGGFYTVWSEPGQGTTIKVSIPQKVIDPSRCIPTLSEQKFSIATYNHFERFGRPEVREYYSLTISNIAENVKAEKYRVERLDELKSLLLNVNLTHLFVGVYEFEKDRDFLEKLTDTTEVILIAEEGYELPAGSRLRLIHKPIYCFPVLSLLSLGRVERIADEEKMYYPNVKALVVDDEGMNLTVARGILGQYGITVKTAISGPIGIDMYKEEDFDIIFMDHMMPGMDGIEAMKIIREIDKKRDRSIPIIAFTANAVSSAKKTFLNEGFDDFVSKPVERSELERVLRRTLSSFAVSVKCAKGDLPESLSASIAKSYGDSASSSDNKQVNTPDNDSALADIGIDIPEGIRNCGDDRELFDSLLLEFITDTDERRSGIIQACDNDDKNDLIIRVHSIKSTAKTIGATEIASSAENLEMMAKEDDWEVVKILTPSFIDSYTDFINALSSIIYR